MPPSIWKGGLSSGAVSIPVKLYTARGSKDISFYLSAATTSKQAVELTAFVRTAVAWVTGYHDCVQGQR